MYLFFVENWIKTPFIILEHIFSILHCNLTNYTSLFKVAINGIGIFLNYDVGKKIVTGIKIQSISWFIWQERGHQVIEDSKDTAAVNFVY